MIRVGRHVIIASQARQIPRLQPAALDPGRRAACDPRPYRVSWREDAQAQAPASAIVPNHHADRVLELGVTKGLFDAL